MSRPTPTRRTAPIPALAVTAAGLLLLGAALLFAGLPTAASPAASPGAGSDRGPLVNPPHDEPQRELLRLRIEGLANYEGGVTLKTARERFEAALELRPESAVELFNLGTVLRKLDEVERARELLEAASQADPEMAHPQYVLGLLDKAKGDNENALAHFRKARDLAPAEPSANYQIGLLERNLGNEEEALQAVTHALSLDPTHSGALYQLYQYHRRVGEEELAVSVMSEFSRLKRAASASRREYNYDESPLSTPLLAIRDDSAPVEDFRPAFEHAVLELPGATGLAWTDADGDGREEIVAVTTSGAAVVAVPAADGEPGLAVGRRLEAAGGSAPFSPRDLAAELFAAEGGHRLVASGKLALGELTSEGPAAGRVAWTPLGGEGEVLAILDVEHDGDLDVLATGGRVFRNPGNARLAAAEGYLPSEVTSGPLGGATGAVAAGFGDLLDSVDLLVWNGEGERAFVADQRSGAYATVEERPAALPGLTWSAAADFDNDGRLDVVSLAGGKLVVERNEGGFTLAEGFTGDDAGIVGAVADFDNDGLKDVVTLAAGRAPMLWHNRGDGRFRGVTLAGETKAPTAVLAADFDGDGRVDLVGLDKDSLVSWRNVSEGTGRWMKVRLTGIRSAPSGRFTRLETRFGRAYQLVESGGGTVHLGLGDADYAEVLRLTWPNGFVENKFKVDAGNTWELEESERVSGSCPTVFSWDGEGFTMITDAFISGPMGVPYGPGRYFPVDDEEYLKIPAGRLVPDEEGRLRVRMTEELRETVYIDHVRLFAVDRPADAEIHPNERLSPEGFPEYGIHCSRGARPAVSARGSRGADLTAELAAVDGRYADTVRPLPYTGFAEPHGVELELPPEADAGDDLRLFLNGWFYYFDSTSMMAVSQRDDLAMIWPEVQVWRDGAWQRLAVAGLPMGKHKTVVVDLSGLLRPGETRLRVWTNAAVYWDAIHWDAAPRCDGVETVHEAPLAEGRLRFRGFSKLEREALASVPEHFDYHRLSMRALWNPMRGAYTRYGAVEPLLAGADSLLAVFGSGDELVLDFDATALPAPAAGTERDWLLYLNGFVKDGDAFTAHAGHVAPMPYAGMTEYPYEGEPEVFSTPAYRRYLEEYQTRSPLTFVGPALGEAGDHRRPYGPTAEGAAK